MKVDINAWWYQVPALFDSTLSNGWSRPRTICSLVRHLTFGWLIAAVVVTGLIWVVFFPIPSFILAIFKGKSVAVYGATEILGMLQILIGILFLISYLWVTIKRRIKPWIDEKTESFLKRRRIIDRQETEPGIVSTWFKSIKEKTCFLVEYSSAAESKPARKSSSFGK